MADPVRKQIRDALKATLEGITVANGYRNDVDTVDFAYLGPDECVKWNSVYIGVIPQEVSITDYPGRQEGDWRFDLVLHKQLTVPVLNSAIADAADELREDVFRALYRYGNLQTSGVIQVSIINDISVAGSEAHTETGVASLVMSINIKFEEEWT